MNAPTTTAAVQRHSLLGRWLGWRLRLLAAVAFAACLAIFGAMRWFAVDGTGAPAAPPWSFWPLAALALVVVLAGAVVALTEPGGASLLYLSLAGCQFVSLLLLAAAAPRPIWWWAQLPLLLLAAVTFGWARREQARQAQPVARLAQRALTLAVAAFAGLGAIAIAADAGLTWLRWLAGSAPWIWGLLVSALLLAPFLMRSRQALGEFTLLAGISTVAAAADLLFVTLLSLTPFASLTLVLFIALAAYAWARQWLFDRVLERHALTTERIFEQLYRTAREVQARPDRYAQHLAALLRDLFEPLEVQRMSRELVRSRVTTGGASLQVPVLPLPDAASSDSVPPHTTLVLRFARRGQRLFAREDALLADRVVEQLRRAVAYDLAVERGRAEERTRIAQDLHDDIGARLLTLMYQAPNAEMEDYVRHTLKDLKTLTRGLAAGQVRWSHALAEWKADLAQRLSAARIELDWLARHDQDPMLGVVQWSALTRVLRELVSNTLHHGHAAHVQVQIQLDQRRLTLTVADDGVGGDPSTWAHGLGLGGVRKRVKLLGGEVAWRRGPERGIVCEVRVAELQAQSWVD